MHRVVLGLVGVMSVACGGDSMHLEYMSTMVNEINGMALHPSEQLGHASMRNAEGEQTTCSFDPLTGTVIDDVDLPTGSERITDIDGPNVLATSSAGVHLIHDGAHLGRFDIADTHAVDAGFSRTGRIMLRADGGECEVVHLETQEVVAVPDCGSQPSLHTHPAWDDAYVLTNGELLLISGGEVIRQGEAAHVDVAPAQNAVYTANGSMLARTTMAGIDVWEQDLRGEITSVSAMGESGIAAVTTDGDVLVIGVDGEVLAHSKMPGNADVYASENGRDLSLVTGQDAHFYTLEEGSQRMTFTNDSAVENPFSD